MTQRIFIDRSAFILLISLGLVLVSVAIALMPEKLVMLIGVLLLGLPFSFLVINGQTRNTAVIAIFLILPLLSILKAITGSRFAPLTFDLAILLACCLHIGEGILRGKIQFGRLEAILMVLWIIAFLGMFHPNVPNLQAGIEGFRKFMFMSVAFILGRSMLRQKDIRLLMRGILLVSIPVSLYGIKQFVVMWPIDYRMIDLATANSTTYLMGGWVRPFSTMPGPFQLGLYLLIVLLLLLAMLTTRHTLGYKRLTLGILLSVQLAVLVMTRTKGNWIGLMVGAVILLLLQSKHIVRTAYRLATFACLAALVLLILFSFTDGAISKVLSDAVFAVAHPLEAPTFVFRMGLWRETIFPALLDRPLFGFGTGSAGEGLRDLYQGTSSQFFSSHNLLLKIWLEMGLVGVVPFVWLISESLLRAMRRLRSLRGAPMGETKLTMLWGIAVVLAFVIGGLVIPTLDAYPPNYYFWLLLGFISRPAYLDESV